MSRQRQGSAAFRGQQLYSDVVFQVALRTLHELFEADVVRALDAAAICKSARLRPIAAALAAAEFAELTPTLCAEIMSHSEEHLEKFAGIATLLQLAYFRPQILEKNAASTLLAAELEQMLARDPAISDEMLESLTSDVEGGMTEDAEGGDMLQEQNEQVQPNNPDPVDEFMAMNQTQSPVLEPATAPDAADSAPDRM